MSTARCYCGEVEITTPDESLWSAHCHCTMCQRSHGAAFVTWVGYEAAKVSVNGQSLTWFESSQGAERGFCIKCGTTLLFRSEKWPGEIHITRANLDSVDRVPALHAYNSSRVDWIWQHDDLPSSS